VVQRTGACQGNEDRTRKSLDATIKFAEWLIKHTAVVSFDCATLYPDKSSIIGQWIWKPEMAKNAANKLGWDFIDYDVLEEITGKWAEEVYIDPLEFNEDFARLCGIRPSILYEYDKELKEIAEKKEMNYGQSQGGYEELLNFQ
jgi:hypothetical protein